MLIFSSNQQSAATYGEILHEYSPCITHKKSDFLSALPTEQIAVIDDNTELLEETIEKNLSQTIIFIGKIPPENEDIIYFSKPVSCNLLLTKIRLLQARIEKGLLSCFSTARYTFNASQKTLNDIRLTQKEAEMIEYLWENKNKIVSKEELLKHIFGYKDGVETHTVETHIYKLRQKIKDDENGLITTKEGGYTLNIK